MYDDKSIRNLTEHDYGNTNAMVVDLACDIVSNTTKDREANLKYIEKMQSNLEDNTDNSIAMIEDEEDVPSDFFDDFSNQDFMAGLDIVDTWDDEEVINKQEKKEDLKIVKKTKKNYYSKKQEGFSSYKKGHNSKINSFSKEKSKSKGRISTGSKDKFKSSGERLRKERSNYYDSRNRTPNRTLYSKERENYKSNWDNSREIKGKSNKEYQKGKIMEDIFDLRRDPEKTKRDIQKDKDRCAKNVEAKIISEKLKVVETGLVPPGTEMEVDLMKLNSEMEKGLKKNKLKNKKMEKSKSPNNDFCLDTCYKTTPNPTSYISKPSYEHRFEKNSENKYKYRSRSPYTGTFDKRFEEKQRRRRNMSPFIIERRSRSISLELSPSSNVSERELWLRNREKKMRKRTASPFKSSNRKKSPGFLEELAKKLKFENKKKQYLEQIQKSLNETSKINYSMVPAPVTSLPPSNNSISAPGIMLPSVTPLPVPYYTPQMDPLPQYDQHYFIGQSNMFHNSSNIYPAPFNDHCAPNYIPIQPHDSIVTSPADNSSVYFHTRVGNVSNNVKIQTKNIPNIQKEKEQEAITKLLEDKKITLSDFLSVTAKHTDISQPINVQKKIKVISICQEAIKFLEVDTNLNGCFFPKKIIKGTEKPVDVKYLSPLRKIPVVRFCFTTLPKANEERTSLEKTLNKLLLGVGLAETSSLSTSKALPKPSSSETPGKTVIIQSSKKKYDPILGTKFQMKMCQTDPVKCHICEIRNARKFIDVGVQCENVLVDSGTQMTEDDIQYLTIKMPIKGILKNQSLAYLTPAQLLANTNSSEVSKRGEFYNDMAVNSSPPHISSIKLRPVGDSSNRSNYSEHYRPSFENPARPYNDFNSSPIGQNAFNDGQRDFRRFDNNMGMTNRFPEQDSPRPLINNSNFNQRHFQNTNNSNFGGRNYY